MADTTQQVLARIRILLRDVSDLKLPDERILTRRASTVVRALLHGRESVKRGFEREFRPIFMTSTTGRSADPVPFLYTQHDLDTLGTAGARLMEVYLGQIVEHPVEAPAGGKARAQDRLLTGVV